MKLLILGATGGTGIEIVREAIELGHEVTVFVRSLERLSGLENRLRIETGDLLNPRDLVSVARGQDAVLSTFGPRVPVARSDQHLLRDFALALTTAMKLTGTRRVLVESAAFLFKNAVIPPAYLVGKLFFPAIVRDQADMERIVIDSHLDWTLIRPPRLTDGERTAKFRMRIGHLPPFGFSISRADVADCFLRLLADENSVRKIVGVSK
jgi:putative NADH-flavin reductase